MMNRQKCFVRWFLFCYCCYCFSSLYVIVATREVIQLIHNKESSGGRLSTSRNATAGISFKILDNVTSIQLKDSEEQTTYFIRSQLSIRFQNIDKNDNDSKNMNNNNTIISNYDTIWRGVIVGDNRTGFCTLFLSSYDGSITGTITTENVVYEFLQKPNGIKEVRWKYWNEFPNDHHNDFDNDNDEYAEDNNILIISKQQNQNQNQQQQVISTTSVITNQSIVTNNVDGYIPLSDSTWIVTKTGVDVTQSIPIKSYFHEIISMEHKQQQTKSQQYLKDDGFIIVDVLIIVTNRAMCEYAGQVVGRTYGIYNRPIRNKITIIEDETNAAMEYSFINVRIKVIGIIFLSNNDYDFISSEDSLNELQNNNQYRIWRDLYGADLVSVIGGERYGACGRGVNFGIMSVVTWSCLGQYSFTHEIGHNFGCRHEMDECESKTGYNFGYTYSTMFRTVMSYSCVGNANCPRLLFYSTPLQTYKGIPIGNAMNADNARMIRSRALSVSQQRNATTNTTPPLLLSCPSILTNITNTCVQKNQMYKRYFGLFCFTKCISESWYDWHTFFGWRCGKCSG